MERFKLSIAVQSCEEISRVTRIGWPLLGVPCTRFSIAIAVLGVVYCILLTPCMIVNVSKLGLLEDCTAVYDRTPMVRESSKESTTVTVRFAYCDTHKIDEIH